MSRPVTAAIAGVGASRQGKLPGETDLSLATEALRAALDDGGFAKDDIDGLLTMPGTTSPDAAKHYLRLGEHLGINPKIAGSLTMGGATAGALVQQAALAVAAGMADVVACVFGDAARTGGSRFSAASGAEVSWGNWGMYGNAANSALGARRHMALYGTTSEQLGWVAVNGRRNAARNPAAVMRDPITIEDHQASRMIVDPLHLLDCCLISDGGVAIIVTTTERARDARNGGVPVLGMGQGQPCRPWSARTGGTCRTSRTAYPAPTGWRAWARPISTSPSSTTTSPSRCCSGWNTPASARPVNPGRSSRAASASRSTASCRSTRRAGTCPSRTCRAGCMSSRGYGRCAASAVTVRSVTHGPAW